MFCQTQIPVFTSLKEALFLLRWFWIGFLFVFIEACSHDETCIIGCFWTIMLKPRKWLMNQRIRKELCTSQNKALSAFSLLPHVHDLQRLTWSFMKFIHWALNKLNCMENLLRVQWIDFISKGVTILRGFSSAIWLTATRLCKAHYRLMMQMQGLRFLGKIDFWFLLKNGCWGTLNISSVSNWNH